MFCSLLEPQFIKHFWHYRCCCSVTQLCPTLCNPMDCSIPSFPVLHHLLELPQTHVNELVMPSNHLILCHTLLLLHSIFPSIRVFSNESALCVMIGAKYILSKELTKHISKIKILYKNLSQIFLGLCKFLRSFSFPVFFSFFLKCNYIDFEQRIMNVFEKSISTLVLW